MMHAREKSDSVIVATKPANKVERSTAEPAEPRTEAEGNASQQHTRRTPSRTGVPQGLERIRLQGKGRRRSSPRSSTTSVSTCSKRSSLLSKNTPRREWTD